jgi:hypothetical protein
MSAGTVTGYVNPWTGSTSASNEVGGNVTQLPGITNPDPAPTQETTYTPYVDPYAALREDFNNQKSSILDSVGSAIGTAGNRFQSGIDQFLNKYKTSQRGINEGGINASLDKQRSGQNILDMVGRNIRSGNVMLANKNAADSSAAGALSRAYGDSGRRQMAGVGNQYETKQREIGLQQQDLLDQANLYKSEFGREKEDAVAGIVDSARQQLNALNEAMIGASLPDRIEIQNEIDSIRQNALTKLNAYDKKISSGLGKFKGISRDEQNRLAAERSVAGYQAGDNMFDYENIDTGQFEDSGALPSDFPLYTFNRGDEQG